MPSPRDLVFHALRMPVLLLNTSSFSRIMPQNSPRWEPQNLEEVDFPLDMARISHGETMEFPGEPHDLPQEKRHRSRITWDEHGRRARRQNLKRLAEKSGDG